MDTDVLVNNNKMNFKKVKKKKKVLETSPEKEMLLSENLKTRTELKSAQQEKSQTGR